jgi:hypothetical protein
MSQWRITLEHHMPDANKRYTWVTDDVGLAVYWFVAGARVELVD